MGKTYILNRDRGESEKEELIETLSEVETDNCVA